MAPRTDPTNADWQRDLFVSYWKLAMTTEPSDPQTAMDWWRKAHHQLAGMKQRGVMNPADQQFLDKLAQKIAAGEAPPPA